MFRGGKEWTSPVWREHDRQQPKLGGWFRKLCWLAFWIALISWAHYARVRWIEEEQIVGYRAGVQAMLNRDLNVCIEVIQELRKKNGTAL